MEDVVIGWIARGLLIVAGFVVSWFVAKDAPQFGLIQMAVAIILFVLVVWVVAFWPERWTHVLSRLHRLR
jgi:hypothetical protein